MIGMTLEEIRTQAKDRADMINSKFVSDAEWLRYINGSYAELYDLLTTTFEDYYTIDTDLSITSGHTVPLPADTYKVAGVSLRISTGTYIPMLKFNWNNRDIKASATLSYLGRPMVQYRLVKDNLYITPTDCAVGTYKLWYIPTFTPLVADSDTTEAMQRWDDLIVISAAIKALSKEESDTKELFKEREEMIARIKASANNRDTGMPETIQDVNAMRYNTVWGGW